MKLYTYWRSTTPFRVRAALSLMGASYDIVPVGLIAGEQRAVSHPANNLRVVGELESRFGATADQAKERMCYWKRQGFAALEART